MPKAYFDSSVLLSVLLAEPKAEEASDIWRHYPDRISSVLLEAECLITVRRYQSKASQSPTRWMEIVLEFLNQVLSGITIKEMDADILSIVRREKVLSTCRTLDAIHLATALYFREKSEEEIHIASFDQRFLYTAKSLNFKVLPLSGK